MAKADTETTTAAVAAPAQRVVPEFRERLAFIGQAVNDFSLIAPDGMRVEDLTDPAAWALAKQAPSHPTLTIGDSIRVIHRDWFAVCVIDQAGAGQPCYALVLSVTPRKNYSAVKRDLITADHDVVQDSRTGHHHAIFFRGRERERVLLGEYSTWQAAVDACRDHTNRTARH